MCEPILIDILALFSIKGRKVITYKCSHINGLSVAMLKC